MGPPFELPGSTELPRDMIRFGDYGEIVLPPEGGGSGPVLSGGIDTFGTPNAADLANIGSGTFPRNSLFQAGPEATGNADPNVDITRVDLGGMIQGVMQLVGLGSPASETVVMPRTQLNALLREMGPPEVLVDPDATGPVDMSTVRGEMPLAARSSSVARVSFGSLITPSIPEIRDVVDSANQLLHQTGLTMPAGQSGPPPPAARWYQALSIGGDRILAGPVSPFRELTLRTLDALDPRSSGNMLGLTGSIQRALVRLDSDTSLTDVDRQRLNSQLANDVASLREATASVSRWQSYFDEHSSVTHTMDHTLASFASPFGQDSIRFNLERRVAQGRQSGESWEDAFVRITGSEMFPASPFPSRVTGADFVSPPSGADLADPWAPLQHGVSLQVDGDPAAFARFVADTVNQGGQNIMSGPVYRQEVIDAMYSGPEGNRMVPLDVAFEDVAPPAALHAWETSHARVDPTNPNRVVVTQSVAVRGADGQPVTGPGGTPVTREITFFVDVRGP